MRQINVVNHPDVILMYQEHDDVESVIGQITELDVQFKAYKLNEKKLHDIAEMKPKVLLLSSNSVKNSIKFYINYLEECEQKIAPHSAVLLISNRESQCAYLACENGLFDNYVITNPMNEPYRLKLVLLQELKIIESHKKNNLEQIMSESESELASCIEHGVALKKSFIQEVNKCETSLLSATNNEIISGEAKVVLQKLIGINLEGMNENISTNIQGIIDQLITLKINNQTLKQNIEQYHSPKKKTGVGVNTEMLTSDENQSLSYKILIAEPSDLFSRVIEEIFSETVFKYLLVNTGQDAITQISAFNPDVVLLAYDLPGINGLDITKKLRNEGNKVPIIAYTHQRDKSMIKRWIPLGLSGYLIKPSKKSAILKSVNRAVKQPIELIHHHKNAGKEDIKWISEYSVGNKDIDEQHKELFTMINDFFHQEGRESAISIFQHLSSYIDLHFDAEENLLRQINYPETENHIKQHNELRKKFHLLQKKLDDYNLDIHHKIALFLYNWLASHILKADMEYKSYALSIEVTSFKKLEV